ncbi:MAG: hypothetical protein PHW61_02385, partial [Eubacteriales bacterium]|nr:hypothetical protein [Eubacteriales bacterium]
GGNQRKPSEAEDGRTFAWLQFYAVSLLGYSKIDYNLTVIGELLDQIEAYKIFHNLAREKRKLDIDDVIPFGID